MSLHEEQKDFLNDYNALLEGLNDEIEGIEDLSPYKMVTKFSEVQEENVLLDEYLTERFNDLNNR